MTTLYKRNNYGEPIFWSIEARNDSVLIIYGIVGKSERSETINSSDPCRDKLSRTNQKRKEGYKQVDELYDNAPIDFADNSNLIKYLNQYLPKFNTDSNDSAKPMLAKTYEYKNGANRLGQWKINGLRCFISCIAQNDMFEPYKLKFTSREGIVWSHLSNTIGKVLLSILPRIVIKNMIDEHFILDGELYIPGLTVNEINHIVKDPTDKRHADLQFWCYDLAVDGMNQIARSRYLYNSIPNHSYYNPYNLSDLKSFHMCNVKKIVIVPYVLTKTEDECVMYRDAFKDAGFEGLILRDPDAEYQFGRRNNTMIKYKPIYDGYFEVIDIIPEGIKRSDLPKFICRNDINNEMFECTIRGSFESQKEYLRNRHLYLGRLLFVEYRERSGVNNLPFHAKAINFKIE